MLNVIESMFLFSDITTANSDTTKHGLLPKLSGHAGQYLGGDGNWYDLPITLNLFMDNTASSIAGYKTLTQVRPVAAETNVSASIPAANTVIEEFAAEADQFSFVSAQVLHVHAHIAKTAGVKTAIAYVSVYHRTSGGTETLLGTSAGTGNLPGSSAPFELDVSVSDTAFSSTDRLVIKFFGTPGGAGTDPTVAVYFQGTTDSRIEIGTSPSLSGYAPIASPTFTGDPKAPTPAAGDNDTSIATTAFVQNAVGWQLIADSTLGADGTFDFQNIPATFKNLHILTSLRTDNAATFDRVYCRLNNDSGANYDYILVELRNAATAFVEGLGTTEIWIAQCAGSTSVASDFAVSEITMIDYLASKNKDILTYGGNRGSAATGLIRLYNFYTHWRSTSAINRITIYPGIGTNFKAGSRIQIYGSK